MNVSEIPKDVPMTEERKKELQKRPARVLPGFVEGITSGKYTFCKKPITEFRDEISEKEYNISGVCQECQDSVFGVD